MPKKINGWERMIDDDYIFKVIDNFDACLNEYDKEYAVKYLKRTIR